jgi:hypothetical protein
MGWRVRDGIVADDGTGEIMAKRGVSTKAGWYSEAVQRAGKLANPPAGPAPDQLFAPSAPQRRARPAAALYVCGEHGGWDAYCVGQLTRAKQPPRCNRAPDHDGPHRLVRRRDFKVLAEWAS